MAMYKGDKTLRRICIKCGKHYHPNGKCQRICDECFVESNRIGALKRYKRI